jgi:hypothetical protein
VSNRKRDDIPQQPPKPQKPVLLNAIIAFDTPKGDIAMTWNASNGDVTINGNLVHNTNDLAVLHTIAKGLLAAKGDGQ